MFIKCYIDVIENYDAADEWFVWHQCSVCILLKGFSPRTAATEWRVMSKTSWSGRS